MISHPRSHVLRVASAALALAGIAATLTGCGGDSAGDAGDPNSVTVSFFPTAGLAPLVHAEDAGMFDDEGLTVENIDIESPPDGIANLQAGRADLAFINVGGMAAALEQGVDLRAVTPIYFFNPEGDQGVYTAPGSEVTRPKDLEGKDVGLAALSNNFHAMVLKAVADDGGDPSKVNFVLVGLADIAAAIRNGKIDAGQVAEPFITANKDDLQALIQSPTDVLQTQPSIVGYMVTTSKFAEENPEALEAFKSAYEDACAELAADDQLARDTVASFTEIDPSILSDMVLPDWSSSDMSIENAEEQLDLMVEYGFIESAPDLGDVVVE